MDCLMADPLADPLKSEDGGAAVDSAGTRRVGEDGGNILRKPTGGNGVENSLLDFILDSNHEEEDEDDENDDEEDVDNENKSRGEDLKAAEEMVEKTEFDAIWNSFLEFEEYCYDAEMESFTAFLTEWQKRWTKALENGLNYSETVLSLKLLKNSRLDKETRTSVFFALQSRPDYMQANLLLFTLSALNKIKNEKEPPAKFNVKPEMFEESGKAQFKDSLDCSEEEYADNSRDEDYEYSESTNTFKCDECPMTCPRLQEFQRHEACHLGPPRTYPCSRCTASFDKMTALDRHLIVHTSSRLKCDMCDKEFFGDKALKYHMKNVHKKHLKCVHCSKNFERQSKLNKHMETHMKRQLATESYFQCDQCGKEIQGKKRLRIHKRTHFQFKCQPCNKIFKDQDLLNRHTLNHREFPCDQCGQVYYQWALLQKHKNTITHGGERKFSCDQCGKTFMKKYNLQTHQLTHTGEKNYKCEFEDCAMAFYKKDVMIRHMRIHTGEKPYQCDICERRFTQSGDMRKHRRTHGMD